MKLFGNRRRAAHAKRTSLPRGVRTALIITAVILLLSGSVFAAWKLLVKPVERPAISAPEPEPPAVEPETPEPSVVHVTPQEVEPEPQPEEDVPTEQPKALRDGVYNILICGTDGDGYRTDTIIIAHLDANNHTVALLSIPRDTPVATGNGGLMKINSVYAGGGTDGMERLASRLQSLLGFPVDGYVLVDLEAFKKTVDLVGGIDFDVPQDMNYDDASQDLHIHLQKGMQHLDGEKAMELVRFRKGYASQDIQRTQVQQQFLKALAKQCLSVGSLTKLKEFADIFVEYVTTNLTTGNMVWFGKELLACDFDAMQTYTAEGEGAMINGASYYPLYAGRLLEIVNAAFNPYDAPIASGSLNVMTFRLPEAIGASSRPIRRIPIRKSLTRSLKRRKMRSSRRNRKILATWKHRRNRRSRRTRIPVKTPSRTVWSGRIPIQIRKEHKTMLSAKEVAALAAKALDAKMGEDIRLIGITDISTLADYFLICTATSSTHVKTLCDAVEEAMDEAGEPMLSREGHRGGTWVLMDFGSLVVHVFTAEARKFYDLERLWQDGHQMNLSAVLGENA